MDTFIPTSVGSLAIQHHQRFHGRPTIVFLHDSLGSITQWRDFPLALGERTSCNVLVYDRQGYGRSAPFSQPSRDMHYMESEAGMLQEILTALHIHDAILFGHSDGGSIALIVAAQYGDYIKGIITEGAHIFVEEETLQGIREAEKLYATTDLKLRLQKYHGDKTEAMFGAWAGTWTSDFFRSWNIEHFLPLIQCPALVIQGTMDEYGTLEQVQKIVSRSKGPAKSWIPEGVGHTPHKEIPETVLEVAAQAIREWTR